MQGQFYRLGSEISNREQAIEHRKSLREVNRQLGIEPPRPASDWCDFTRRSVIVVASPDGFGVYGLRMNSSREQSTDILTVTRRPPETPSAGRQPWVIFAVVPDRERKLVVRLRERPDSQPITVGTFPSR